MLVSIIVCVCYQVDTESPHSNNESDTISPEVENWGEFKEMFIESPLIRLYPDSVLRLIN